MIYSVGHSNYSIEQFIEILKLHGIELVVDVRGIPYSKHVPHFNREQLRGALEKEGLGYRFAGKFLGNKGEIPKNVREQGIDGLVKYSKRYSVAMMCSERDYRKCHRHLILTPMLLERNEQVFHIVGEKLIEASMNDFAKEQTLF